MKPQGPDNGGHDGFKDGCFAIVFMAAMIVLAFWATNPPKGYHRGYRGWIKDPPLVYDWNWKVIDGKVVYK